MKGSGNGGLSRSQTFNENSTNVRKGPKNACWDPRLSDCLLPDRRRCESTVEGWNLRIYRKNNNVGVPSFISSGAPYLPEWAPFLEKSSHKVRMSAPRFGANLLMSAADRALSWAQIDPLRTHGRIFLEWTFSGTPAPGCALARRPAPEFFQRAALSASRPGDLLLIPTGCLKSAFFVLLGTRDVGH